MRSPSTPNFGMALICMFGMVSIDEQHISSLKAVAAGSADDSEIKRTLRTALGKFGATDPTLPDWRQLTRKLAQAELAALDVSGQSGQTTECLR